MPNIGKYEIESRIGHGGMGDVYRAFDPTLRRKVAIKVLKVGDDAETLNRFRLEATSAGNLNHPNIVTIHDYGDFEGEPYLVMEYLEGQDLQRTIESGKKFDLVEITAIMSQVADALECAHQHGVIHRDVKPANIMLLARGGIKLMDFGIARLTGANTQQTKAGHLIGTVLYMSPEQFHNLELDRRVDIWAYGVIYYQLLAGKHPFEVPDQIVTMYNIANKPAPPICSINREVPEALGQIVDRCLSKDRDLRYSTMEDLRFDVLPVLQDLEKQQAARMLADARNLMEKADWDGAQAIVRRVLELDPADRSAHALRKTIGDALRKRETAPRIEGLISTAEQHVAAKEYEKALGLLETALKLDPGSSALRQRADEVRDLQFRSTQAAQHLLTATSAFESAKFTEAYEALNRALRFDPALPEANRLMAAVRDEIAKRERQQLLEEGLENSRQLLRAGSFDAAILALQEIRAKYPGTLEASQMLREAECARDEDCRHRKLQSELASIKEHLRLQHFAEAVQCLEALNSEFPGQNEVPQLLNYAREEWKVRQRATALDRAKENILKLQGDGRFEEAIRSLDRAQSEFPAEPDLLRLSQAIAAAKAEAERRGALEQVVSDARGQMRSGHLTEALRIADLALQQHGPDENLLGFREQLEREWQNAQRRQALQKAVAEGRQFAGRNEWEKAIAHFQHLVRQYPDEAEPRTLLDRAQTALKQEQREQRQRVEAEVMGRAEALEKENQRESALAEIESGLRLHPDSPVLAEARTRLVREIANARTTHEREVKLDEARRNAQAEQQRRAREAEQAAERTAEDQRRQQAAKVEDLLAKAYLAIGQSEPAKAAKLIAEARKVDPNHPGIARTQSDLDAASFQPAQKSNAIKGIGIGAAAAIAVLAGVFFLLPKPAPKPEAKPALPATTAAVTPAVAASHEKAATPEKEVPPPPANPPPTTPGAQPVLRVSPEYLVFNYQPGSPDPPARTLYLAGSGRYQATPRNPQWVSVSPSSGTLPAQISVAVHTGQLMPGSHTNQVVVTSSEDSALTSLSTIKLTVAEPIVTQPPPPVTAAQPPPPTTVIPPAEEKKPTPGIFLGGRRAGDLVWTGTLAPGGKVVIGPGGVISGGGAVVRAAIPREVPFDVSNVPAGIHAVTTLNLLTIINESDDPMQGVTIHWAVK